MIMQIHSLNSVKEQARQLALEYRPANENGNGSYNGFTPLTPEYLDATPIERADQQKYFRSIEFYKRRVGTIARRGSTIKKFEEARRSLLALVNRWTEANIPLVHDTLKRMHNLGIMQDEAFSEGLLALYSATKSFDYTRGFKFSTYAVTSIKRRIFGFSRKEKRVCGRRTDLTEYIIDRFVAVEEPAKRSDGMERELEAMAKLLDCPENPLSDRELLILSRRFPISGGEKKTLEEIGKKLGIGKERVRQVQNCALKKLRAALEEQLAA